jgi:hypothetical protein
VSREAQKKNRTIFFEHIAQSTKGYAKPVIVRVATQSQSILVCHGEPQ